MFTLQGPSLKSAELSIKRLDHKSYRVSSEPIRTDHNSFNFRTVTFMFITYLMCGC